MAKIWVGMYTKAELTHTTPLSWGWYASLVPFKTTLCEKGNQEAEHLAFYVVLSN
jgi:hypothetical protein